MGIKDDIKESIAPISSKLSGFNLRIINPESKLARIKKACQGEVELRFDSTEEFDLGTIHMASKILKIIEE